MGLTKINGLPAHVLLVHIVVVMVPLSALALLLSVLWPVARRRLGGVTPLLALVALISVPITTHAGEWLKARLPSTPAIEHHAQLGRQLLPWAAGMFLVALVHWLATRRANRIVAAPPTGSSGSSGTGGGGVALAERTTTATGSKLLTAVLAVLAILAAAGSVWMVYRIGDSGAQTIWKGVL